MLRYKMPVDIGATHKVLQDQAETGLQYQRATRERAYQVAWATCRDMIAVQMAMVRIHAVKMQQVFLPYLLSHDEQYTLYDVMENEKFLLPTESQSSYTIEGGD